MTPTRYSIARHLTAAVVAVTMAGLLLLGFDGLLGAMHKLSGVLAAARTPPPVAAPVAEAPATPGVVPVFVVPADDAAKGDRARQGGAAVSPRLHKLEVQAGAPAGGT